MIKKYASSTVKKSRARFLGAGLLSLGMVISGFAEQEYEVYVLRVGDGTQVTSEFKPFSIVYYTGEGNNLEAKASWEAPSTDPEDRITMAPGYTTYSYLNSTEDGRHLVFTGLDVEVGMTEGSATTTVIGAFDLDSQTFDTSTRPVVSDEAAALRKRSVASVDGSGFWFAGQGGGVWYAELGADEGVMISSVGFQFADLQIFEDDLYVGRRAGGTRGVWVWDGLPTTEDNVEITRLQNEDNGSGWESATPAGGYGSFQFYDEETMFMNHLNEGVHSIEVFVRGEGTYDWNLLTGEGQRLDGLQGITHLSAVPEGDQVRVFYTSGTGTADSSFWSVAWDPEERTFGEPEWIADAEGGYSFGGVVAIPAAAVDVDIRITRIDVGDSEVTIDWTGGEGPYQLQRRASLIEGDWENIGDPTESNQISDSRNAAEDRMMFYRVLGN